MNAGDAFQLIGVADRHLWIIISDPIANPDEVLFVSLTTHDPREDQTVILDVGDHPFIANRTCISFSRARTATNIQLEQLKVAGRISLHVPATAHLLRQLRAGAARSNRIQTRFLKLLQDQGLAYLE